jgi:polyphosphate kinase
MQSENSTKFKMSKKETKTYTEAPYINRDMSWLAFNHRVLQEAKDPSVPLFERIKFLGIYSSNLDEFFRVRVASIKGLIRLGKITQKELDFPPDEILEMVTDTVKKQQIEFTEIYQKHIIPQLASINIHILKIRELNDGQKEFLDDYIEEKLIPYLQPILIVKHKIRTFLINNALYLGVVLATKGTPRYAVVRIPSDRFPRFIQLPVKDDDAKNIIMLDDIVRHALPNLFPGYTVKDSFSFKMTRDAELYLEDEYSGDLIEKIKVGLNKRNLGSSTRFVYDRTMPDNCLKFLMEAFSITNNDLQPEGRYHNNFDLFKFPDFNINHFKDKILPPLKYKAFERNSSMFNVIAKKDHLLHFPYHRYSYVIRLLEQAAHDPNVTHIKILQYRVAKNSQIIAALRSAIEAGKNVMVFVELKARFDEEANIFWAEQLEEWGAIVKYSLPEIKVHSKLLMISRNEEGEERDYCYLSSGNFNEQTANIYEDYGFFTSDNRICGEVERIFQYLESGIMPPKPFEHLLVGQFRMRKNIYEMIENEMENARNGKPASIVLKLNSIQDPRIIDLLYEASNAGVKIKMIVRGICSLVPKIKGFSENIEVISIVDRFLEHSRIYIFHNDGDEKIYLSSADWMTRNLYHRIECAFPIYDQDLRQDIKNFLEMQFNDNVKARYLDAEMTNRYCIDESKTPYRSQIETYKHYQKLHNNAQ